MNSDPPPAAAPDISTIPVPTIPVDPNLAAEQTQANNTLVANLQTQAQGDTASLMARYGTRLALAGGSTAPMSAPAAPAVPAATPAAVAGAPQGSLASIFSGAASGGIGNDPMVAAFARAMK